MMDDVDLTESFKKAIFLSMGTRIQRLKKDPIKLLYSKILERIALFSNKPIKVKAKTFWNEDMFVVIPEEVSLCIYHYGFFEEGLTRMILEYLKPGMTFFDIGTHFGYFTLLGSFIVGGKGQVHAFEPTPSSFSTLKSNAFDKHNVVLNNCAVTSKRRIVIMNDYGIRYSAYNSMYNSRLPKNIISKLEPQKYEIEAISIDEYIENKGISPDFIKIDAESSEYEIILGMEKTIVKSRPIISIEVGDFGVEGVPTSKELINFLINKNYKPYEFKNGKILKHGIKDKYQYDNLLFLPN